MTEPAITGSIISGTLRAADLLPAFVDALEQIAPDAPTTVQLRADVNGLEDRDGFDAMESGDVLSDLFDALNDALPDGWVFGAHEGDGSDFGVWEVDEDD